MAIELRSRSERTPQAKLVIAILIGALLAIPLFSVWALVYDRQSQSRTAEESITQGWGGSQTLTGPLIAIPYRATREESVVENGRRVTTTRNVVLEMTLAPELLDLDTAVDPERRSRSIYEAVVYETEAKGNARFAFPRDLDRYGIAPEDLLLERAELRFGIADPRGLGANPTVSVGGEAVRLQPGGGSDGGTGFFAFIDASALRSGPLETEFAFTVRGNRAIGLDPVAGETRWKVTSPWPHPSFTGSFLPEDRGVSERGFTATWRIGNLALGKSLVATDGQRERGVPMPEMRAGPEGNLAVVELIQPVDLYSRVNRATKYGFLHIGFTFLALLMFDIVGGRRIAGVAYLLVGAALVLFFVLLLAFAEVIGFASAYLVASLAIIGLVVAYLAAVLGSWRRAGIVGAMLGILYAMLYILLGLEAYALLIGSLLIFMALAAVMYVTRNLDWSRRSDVEA
ncbi:cell envelope integrity protein CreD [Sphingomicrobium nitratireducens]|uniref:cell envelope integrity protein CreD n=1 Tax=Sphingomicrobium nitratireducens TaxID=2964666 RepID=UPI002240B8C7|nr:cell envelope integrity protein CreD [Sphingomicrobium nitratireducens]